MGCLSWLVIMCFIYLKTNQSTSNCYKEYVNTAHGFGKHKFKFITNVYY